MRDNSNIPNPDQSGSKGTQLAAITEIVADVAPMQGLHVASTMEGLAATNTKAFGGEIPAAAIGAAMRQVNQDYFEMKRDNLRLFERLEKMRDDLEDTRTKNAVLTERIRSDAKNKNLKNFSIAIGMGLMGIGLTLWRAGGQDGYAITATLLGALLLGLGWFSSSKEEKK
jgi:hypothetical protein